MPPGECAPAHDHDARLKRGSKEGGWEVYRKHWEPDEPMKFAQPSYALVAHRRAEILVVPKNQAETACQAAIRYIESLKAD